MTSNVVCQSQSGEEPSPPSPARRAAANTKDQHQLPSPTSVCFERKRAVAESEDFSFSSLMNSSSLWRSEDDWDWDDDHELFYLGMGCHFLPNPKLKRPLARLEDLIRNHRWEEAMERIDSLMFQDEASEKISLATPSSTSSRTAFPLHLACMMRPLPPVDLILALLDQHAEAASVREGRFGFLPLHLACKFYLDDEKDGDDHYKNQCRIVRALVEAHPDGVLVREDVNGMLPIHIMVSTVDSCSEDVVATMRLLLTSWGESIQEQDDQGDTPLSIAERSSESTWIETTLLSFDGHHHELKQKDFAQSYETAETVATEDEISTAGNTLATCGDESNSKAMQFSMKVTFSNICLGAGKGKVKKGKLRRPNPFFLVEYKAWNGAWKLAYQSHPLLNTRRGSWEAKMELPHVPLTKLSSLHMRITVYDCHKRGKKKHRLIGTLDTSLEDLMHCDLQKRFEVTRDGKVKARLKFESIGVHGGG